MITLNIATEFTDNPGARNYSDGPKSGEEFFDTLLKEKYLQAVAENTQLRIILDGTTGFASSFLNESFGLLGNEYGADEVWNRLEIISNEIPKYIVKVKSSIYEKRK